MSDLFRLDDAALPSQDHRVRVLVAAGELDIGAVEEFHRRLEAGGQGGLSPVVLDLRWLEFIDSSGLAALVKASAPTSELALVIRPGSQVARILELAGVEQVLSVFEDLDQAVDALTQPKG